MSKDKPKVYVQDAPHVEDLPYRKCPICLSDGPTETLADGLMHCCARCAEMLPHFRAGLSRAWSYAKALRSGADAVETLDRLCQ